jgi:hypothetical protein
MTTLWDATIAAFAAVEANELTGDAYDRALDYPKPWHPHGRMVDYGWDARQVWSKLGWSRTDRAQSNPQR